MAGSGHSRLRMINESRDATSQTKNLGWLLTNWDADSQTKDLACLLASNASWDGDGLLLLNAEPWVHFGLGLFWAAALKGPLNL